MNTLLGQGPKITDQPTIAPGQGNLLAQLTADPAKALAGLAPQILQPATQQFNASVLPALSASFGREAGMTAGLPMAQRQAGQALVTGENASLIELLNSLFGGATRPTMDPVVQQASPGLLQGFLGSPLAGAGLGVPMGNWLTQLFGTSAPVGTDASQFPYYNPQTGGTGGV
jgi:hypothetical protein